MSKSYKNDKKQDFLRVPPHSEEAEISVIGGILLREQSIYKVNLEPEDFYKESHKIIFMAIKDLQRKNEPIDQVSLTEKLVKINRLEEVGGAYYITGLYDSTPSSANIEHWSKIVKEKSDYRKMIIKFSEMINNCYDQEMIPEDIKHENISFLETMESDSKEIRRISDHTERWIEEKKRECNGDIEFIPTGFSNFDSIKGGYRKGNLVVIAARPGNGKTSKMIKEALYQSQIGYKVGFFSFEMGATEIMDSMVQIQRNTSYDYRKGLNEEDIQYSKSIFDTNIYFDDSFNSGLSSVLQRIRIMKAKYGVDSIFIDYLQLMSAKGEKKREQLAEITRSLKLIAKELDIVVVIGCQISRAGADKPTLNDLKGSGTIEEDADIVFIIHTPINQMKSPLREVNYNIEKYRKGRVDSLPILFKAECTNFIPVDRRWENENV